MKTVVALLVVIMVSMEKVLSHSESESTMSDDQISLLHSILHRFQYFSNNIRDLPGLAAQLKISFGEDLGQTLINVLSLGIFDLSFLERLLPTADAVSDLPSDVPSDAPSLVPSDAPSMVPSDAPSISPKFWDEDWDPKNDPAPEGFVSCEDSGGTEIDMDDAPKLTVLYGYRIELEPNMSVTPAVQTIEDMILAELYNELCSKADEGALAISHMRDDKPGAWCEQTGGPCFYITGKVELIVSDDVVKDSQPVYCKALGAVGSVLSTTADSQAVVHKVTTTLPTDDRSKLCELVGDRDAGGAPLQDGSATFSARNRPGLQWTIVSMLAAGILGVVMFVSLVIWNRRRPARSPRSRSRREQLSDFASMINLHPRRDVERNEDDDDDDSFVSFTEVWKAEST